MALRIAQSAVLHTLLPKTSEHDRPIASSFDTPVIFSAALLNDVIVHSKSTVKTPSSILSNMILSYSWFDWHKGAVSASSSWQLIIQIFPFYIGTFKVISALTVKYRLFGWDFV
jgi:hypothetical protein